MPGKLPAPPARSQHEYPRELLCHELTIPYMLPNRDRKGVGAFSQPQKHSHAIQLRLKLPPESSLPRRLALNIPQLRLKLPVLHRNIRPANHAIAPKQRQSVIAELAFGRGRVRLETAEPTLPQ